MRKRANVFLLAGALTALQVLFPMASPARDEGDPEGAAARRDDDRWVPSLAITGGAAIQELQGSLDSFLFEDGSPDPVDLRGFFDGDDRAVDPFVGGSLELMAPALPIPARPRLFVSGEILPTFASERAVAVEGDPGCIRGPEVGAICARDEDGSRTFPFGEDSINGAGGKTIARIDTLVYGARLGAAFPVRIRGRQLRIKPSVGWISYAIDAEGVVVDGACDPLDTCTDWNIGGFVFPGFLRETILTASDSRRYNGIGPGLDIEMDAGRFGPLGVSLFLGGSAYRILDDDPISFGTSESFDDQLGMDVEEVQFEIEVDPWMYRAHVGIRFQWLGRRE